MLDVRVAQPCWQRGSGTGSDLCLVYYFRHILIVFGGVAGLEESKELDKSIKVILLVTQFYFMFGAGRKLAHTMIIIVIIT